MKSWFGWKTMGVHGFAALYPGVKMVDPSYFTDFWTKPGYLGHDHPEWFDGYRMQFQTKVAEPITAAEAARLHINTDASNNENRGGVDNAFKVPEGAAGQRIVGFRLTGAPPSVEFIGGDLIVRSGARAGQSMPVARIAGDIAVLGFAEQSVASALQSGDEVTVDNSNWLAMESYQRHQVPGPDFKVWDQFRDSHGKPLYPQRPMLLGPLFTRNTSGSGMTGKFEGKMILCASLWDREAMPWQADWYYQRAAANFGADAKNHLRLYYTDHALHGDEPGDEDATRIVSYQGVLQQALRDLSGWVEKGTGYEFLPRWWNKSWFTKWFITTTFHDQHHRYFIGNFGGYTTIWDYLCGTVRKKYEADFDAIKARAGGGRVTTDAAPAAPVVVGAED